MSLKIIMKHLFAYEKEDAFRPAGIGRMFLFMFGKCGVSLHPEVEHRVR